MKSAYKRIIAFTVSISVAGAGVGAYFSGKDDPFDPDKYSLNDKLNKNQITFDEDNNNNYSGENDDGSGESTHWEQDNTSDKTIGNNNKPDSPVLFQTKKDNTEPPTIIEPENNGGDAEQDNTPDDNNVTRDDRADNVVNDPGNNTYVVRNDTNADDADITIKRPDNADNSGNVVAVPSEENPIKVHPNIIYSTFCGSRMFLFSVSPLSRNL